MHVYECVCVCVCAYVRLRARARATFCAWRQLSQLVRADLPVGPPPFLPAAGYLLAAASERGWGSARCPPQ